MSLSNKHFRPRSLRKRAWLLGISASYLSMLVNGRRLWRGNMKERYEAVIEWEEGVHLSNPEGEEMASADWYIIQCKNSNDSWTLRKSGKYREVSQRIIALSYRHTLMRIGNKKKGALSSWLKDMRYSSSTPYKEKLPETFNSACGWEMNVQMKHTHESQCKRCVFAINEREVKADAAQTTSDLAKEANDYNRYAAPVITRKIEEINKMGRSSKNSPKRNPEIQKKAQEEVAATFEQAVIASREVDEIFGKAIDSVDLSGDKTKETWIAIRDEAEKVYLNAISEIEKIEAKEEEEKAEGKKLLAEFESKMGPMMEIMEQYKDLKEKFG